MKLMRVIITLVCLIAIAVPALAMMDKVGTAGALFLKIGMDPRRVAMGEASGAVVGDAASVFSNPAGLAALESREVFVSDTEWLAGIRLISGVYAFPFSNRGVIALSAVTVNYGEMPLVREMEADVVVEQFSPRDIALGISYATKWTDRLLIGGSFKYIDQSISDLSSRGIAFDFGTVYYTGFRTLRLAMVTNNFGPDMRFDGNYTHGYYIGTAYVEQEKIYGTYDLPLNFRIGMAYDFHPGQNSRLTAVFDATHPSDYSERVHFGSEYAYGDKLFLRMGYTSNAEEMGLSAGCGLNMPTGWGKGFVDYAYTDFGVFQGVHRVALGVSF
jgi:long-subunit fatty acid transport protein